MILWFGCLTGLIACIGEVYVVAVSSGSCRLIAVRDLILVTSSLYIRNGSLCCWGGAAGVVTAGGVLGVAGVLAYNHTNKYTTYTFQSKVILSMLVTQKPRFHLDYR